MGSKISRAWCLGLAICFGAIASIPALALAQQAPLLTKIIPAQGNDSAPQPPDRSSAEPDKEKQIREQLARAEAELAALGEADSGEQELPPGAKPSEVEGARDLLTRLVMAYRQQLARLQDLADMKAYKEDKTESKLTVHRLAESDSYSFIAVDQLREAERSIKLSYDSLDASGKILTREYDRNAALLKQLQAEARQAVERIETNRSPERVPRLRWLGNLAELRSRLQGATLEILDLERRLNDDKRRYEQARLKEIGIELARTRGKVVFSAAELEQVKANLEEERQELANAVESASNARDAARRRLREAEEALADANKDAPQGENAERAILERTVELRRAELENLTQAARLLSFELQGLVREGEIWDKRWALSQAPDAEEIAKAAKEVERERKELGVWGDFIEQRRAQARSLVVEHEALTKRAQSTEESLYHTRLAELYRQRLVPYEDFQQTLGTYIRLVDLWAKDIDTARGAKPLRERFQSRVFGVWEIVRRVWDYEVFTVEDQIEVEGRMITGKRGVTIGKFVSALLILALGYWGSRWLSRRIERFAIRRLRMEASIARLVRRWTDAVGLLVLVIIALALVKIPLTVFAFLGGAVAIGIGFGTQTLFKNLISGLMILFERPFHLNDLVEVGTVRGRVSDIGLRSSVVRDMHGIETLIPNSSFLEQNVTNWTYTTERVRFSVLVGVAYGSETRKVRDLLVEVGKRHGLVLKDPSPFVLFDEFGADALLFSLNFWLELSQEVDRWVVQSDLRFMIAEAFSKADITVAFPQRDVHLETPRPLEIRMIPPSGGEPSKQT